jgi:hypothetical protein
MGMASPTLYFFTPDLPHVLGGVRQIYRHVDVLNANGFDAWVVHRKKGFKIKWFEHETRTMYEPAPMRKNLDIGVFPEIWGSGINRWGQNIRKVILNQNAYYTWKSQPLKGKFEPPYLNPQVIATIVVSEDSKRYLEYVFPKMRVYRIRYRINEKLYFPEQKKRQICLMPRKNLEDVKQVLHNLRCRGALDGWKVVLIDKFSEAQAAAVIRESAVYASTSHPEGFGLPPCEALACGCIVVGYHGGGGKEFLLPEFSYPIQVGDIVGFVKTAELVLKQYARDSNAFRAMTEKAAAFVAGNYSQDRERQTILETWQKILEV